MNRTKQQLIREHKQRMRKMEGQKPKERITKKRKRMLLLEAFFADLLDAGGGTIIPVLGDIASPFIIYKYFTWRFNQYDVDASEFMESGTGGRFGKITTWTIDMISGFVPFFGDFIDLFVASWIFTIYTTINKIQEKDTERKRKHEKQAKKERQRFRQQLQALNMQRSKTRERV
jgi:large-conductance mechanosensitive channel